MEKENNVVNKNKCFPGKFLSGVSRLYSRLVNKETTLFYQQRISGRSRIKCGITPVFNNSAFTLIELLVVVLIIGILASVALPQYNLAVAKARISRLLPLMKSIVNAQKVYKMANGVYANDLSLLDIEMPTGDNAPFCWIGADSSLYCRDKKYALNLEKYYDAHATCWAYNSATAQRLCKYLCQTNQLSAGNGCVLPNF